MAAKYSPAKRIDVARRAGVSVGAVSQVLNNTPGARVSASVREKILSAASELNYVPSLPARSLKMGRTGIIGVVVCNRPGLFGAYFGKLLSGIWDVLVQYSLKMCVDILPENLSATELFHLKVTDGIIFIAPPVDICNMEMLVKAKYPFVCIGDTAPVAADYVDIDNEQTGYQAMRQLLDAGHHDILIIRGSSDYSCSSLRLQGAATALAEQGLHLKSEYIIESHFVKHDAYDKMTVFLQKNLPFTAIFAASDDIALGAIKAMQEHGLSAGKDISVIAIDGLVPSDLTTMCQPAERIGDAAAKLLLERIDQPELPTRTRLFNAEMIVGASTCQLK